MRKKTIYNIVFGFGSQLVIIALGFVVPRIILTHYGSDTNGLTSTVTQIFTYMALLEAGISQATRNALYKPIKENNREGVSYIMSVSKRYYHKITMYYGIGVVLLSVLLPLIIKSNLNYWTIFFIVLFEGMSGVILFWYIENWTQLLMAEGRNYIVANFNMFGRILSYAIKIVLACVGINIVVIQLGYFMISLVRLLLYMWYMRKNYPWIDYNVAPRDTVLKDRNAFIITEIAWTIFSSTDMIVLSVFSGTEMSSVYSIYNMVFVSIMTLLNAVYQGTIFLLGQAYHESREKYILYHDTFDSVYMCAITILMSVSYVLILPFVRLYTSGVSDVNYIYSQLPLLFCLVQMLSWGRYASGNLTGMAGFAKQVSRISLVEALINIIMSVILVVHYGIVGVLTATMIALPLKMVYVIWFANVKILKRSVWRNLTTLTVNFVLFAIIVVFNRVHPLQINNFLNLIKWGVILTVGISIIDIAVNAISNPKSVRWIWNMIKSEK